MKKTTYDLNVDTQLEALTVPLSTSSYAQLERSLSDYGCLCPIVVWNNIILDGHKRYEICCNLDIPFSIVNRDFICRSSAIAWICANQLHNTENLIEETRKYLIGREYAAIVDLTPTQRKQQSKSAFFFASSSTDSGKKPSTTDFCTLTATWVAKDNNISLATVQKYAVYAKSIDKVASKVPDIVPSILSGTYKISHNDVIALSRMTPEEIQKVRSHIEALQKAPFVQYKNTRAEIHKCNTFWETKKPATLHSVKDVPEFDPDTEITGLTLTVPSWSSSIERVRTKSNLTKTSAQARRNLSDALHNHMKCILDMLSAIKEDLMEDIEEEEYVEEQLELEDEEAID